MEPIQRKIEIYVTTNEKCPYINWLNSLRDICELRIDYGAGYRVYFGQVGASVVLLLCGGDKSSQEQDILKAQEYWEDYRSRGDV